MDSSEIRDPLWREAVSAIDAGDVATLERLLESHPGLVRDRLPTGEGYFRHPYLLWFVAENPVRTGRLPDNIVAITRAILQAARRQGADTFREQVHYALVLVASGRVPRERGVQRELIDLLCDAGADPGGALMPALAHRELDAAERLLERGAELTLTAAVGTGRAGDVARLLPSASAADRQAALTVAAFYGRAEMLILLLGAGVDLNAYGPSGFHQHGTPLHHAVDSGSLAAVRVLVEAGADAGIRDRIHDATPLGWAEYLGRKEIAASLR